MAHDWTFLSSHGLVFLAVARTPTATLREIGDAVGITERAAQRLVSDLVEAGYLRRFREGRRNRYEVVRDKSLRHPLSDSSNISEMLDVLGASRRDLDLHWDRQGRSTAVRS